MFDLKIGTGSSFSQKTCPGSRADWIDFRQDRCGSEIMGAHSGGELVELVHLHQSDHAAAEAGTGLTGTEHTRGGEHGGHHRVHRRR